MNSELIIESMGGRQKVIKLTGLTRGRISQWVIRNDIPKPWLLFFKAKYPKLNWKQMLNE